MARGISVKDFKYEVETVDTEGDVVVQALMLVSMDEYNIGTAATKVQNSTNTDVELIEAHIKLSKNEREFGIHPRHAILEWAGEAEEEACFGVTPKRFVKMPILTIAQFATLNVYNELTGGTQANTTLVVNHSFDGTASLTYKIRKLNPEVKV
ncbi:hypothetical protein B9G53_03500 [Pseudanabaena sp. SR411]|uniref:hypothetical protein n=1 Tax=Pseudanabaena sp. SR411 TaxID=1980935 RepID=UPI000B995961|nr:hypothetical protein [Pseudanabaena sp. SR411]OYQ66645.1 hypothetical protein B9G53_03500 [Pseudanabaena sp. SR411]